MSSSERLFCPQWFQDHEEMDLFSFFYFQYFFSLIVEIFVQKWAQEHMLQVLFLWLFNHAMNNVQNINIKRN